MMSTLLQKLRPRPEATASSLKNEANECLQRATNLEKTQQYDEASVLYKRVISLIASHEGTSAVDDELNAIKRNTNQRLLQSSLQQTRSTVIPMESIKIWFDNYRIMFHIQPMNKI